MTPQELLRGAAALIEKNGFYAPPKGSTHHCCDAANLGIPLWSNTRSGEAVDTSRANVNPAAVRFSIYGAIVAAMTSGGGVSNMALMWDTLYRRLLKEPGMVTGGINYVHPVIQYNNAADRTQEEIVALLNEVAADLDAMSSVDTKVVQS